MRWIFEHIISEWQDNTVVPCYSELLQRREIEHINCPSNPTPINMNYRDYAMKKGQCGYSCRVLHTEILDKPTSTICVSINTAYGSK